MPGYKKPKMGHKKPKMAHGKKPKMAHAKKPQFNAKLKQAAKEGKLDDNPKFKAAVEKAKPKMYHKKPKMGHEPKMYNKKPFMMKPGSKQVDSPGSFKANEPAMMFKNNMPKDHRAGHPKDKEREKQREAEIDKDREAYIKGDVGAYGKRLRQPGRSKLNLPEIDDKAVTKALAEFPSLKPPKTQGDSIAVTSFYKKGGMHSSTYNKRIGRPSIAEKIAAKRNKPKMYGSKPKMYGKKK